MFKSFKSTISSIILTCTTVILSACGSPTQNVGYSYAPTTIEKADKYYKNQPVNTNSIPRDAHKSIKKKAYPKRSTKHSLPKKRIEFGPILNKLNAMKAINAYRRAKGLRPLRYNRRLEKAAQRHSKDMAKIDRITHIGSDGSDPWDRIVRVGYPPEMATENIGGGVKRFDKLFALWKASRQHNANLLIPDATDMGMALIYERKGKIKSYWTLVIAKRGARNKPASIR